MRLIGMVIQIAPVAIFCFMFNLSAQFGWELLFKLAAYVAVVLLALGLQMFVVFPAILKFVAGKSPIAFFSETREARSEESRVGKEGVCTCSFRWWPKH